MNKARAGFTLVEQIAVIAMLLIIMTMVGGSLTAVFDNYRLQRQLLDDHNDIRLALLNLTRDINQRDPEGAVTFLPPGATGPGEPGADITGFSFDTPRGHIVTYSFAAGTLGRTAASGTAAAGVEHPVPFMPVQLENVVIEHLTIADGEWLRIEFEGRGFGGAPGHRLEATLSLSRLVAQPQPTPTP